MNWRGILAIYQFEMSRTRRTIMQSIISPVISTTLYFVVFGAAIGARMENVENIEYGAFIVPGLMMLTVLTQAVSNGAFGIYFPKFTGTIFELLSAPISFTEATLGYVGAAATKAIIIGLMVLLTAFAFAPLDIQHPILMVVILLSTAITFAMLGFIIGIWASNFEQLQLVPLLVITPLVFLGGSFYSIEMLPEPWQTISHFNPVFYLISGFRYAFFGQAEVAIFRSLAAIAAFFLLELWVVARIFKTGYKLRK
ncbi:MAG: ABC transporter permease [Gammaproteobacteria bacterium]|nr:ABC transporter permease [Gammaproteobacteria bacterium]